jgi:ABC-2 type transport system ATP-binding protein
MISVRDLRVDYGDVCAVNDLEMKIGPGEVFGLIGPNGSGKTTTMKVLAGLLMPTYGDVQIDGIDIREHPQIISQKLGYMPDFPPLYEDLLVWEFLDLFAASYFIPKSRRRAEIDRRLEEVGLMEKRDRFTKELSRGMRQRLMLAKTMLPEPKVLLLDEPASGMDPHGRALMKQVIRDFAAAGGCVLISSHILSEMDEFCSTIGIMQRGKMVISGSMDHIAASVTGQSQLVVELVSGEPLFRRIIEEHRLAGNLVQHGDLFEFPFDGDKDAAADLLSQLVQGGVRVSAFHCKRKSLEDVFLQIGVKEVS